MQPLLDKAADIKAAVVDLKERLKHLKKDKAGESEVEALEADIREQEKTFAGFIKLSIWGAAISIGILIFMALVNA